MKEGTKIKIEITKGKRTSQQNNALHLYFSMLAQALNDAGFDMRKTVRAGIDIPWTAINIKEYLWKPIQKEYLRKKSTKELNKNQDIDFCYDILNRAISERCGVSIPFPSYENTEPEEYQK